MPHHRNATRSPGAKNHLLALCFSLFLAAVGVFSGEPGGSEASVSELGSVNFSNSGSAEAQKPFLMGLAALHSFFYDEAADLFQEARKIDPEFAMAYWGEAMTHNHPLWREQDREAAKAVMNRFAPTREDRLAKIPTDRERAYWLALETLFGDGEKVERDRAYAQRMQALTEAYPDDLDAAAFAALALMGTVRPTDRDFIRTNIRAAANCQPLYRRNPNHPGVLHYLIHAFDDPIHAPLGLPYAQKYAVVAPAAHHARHMPSHIFVQLGMWDEVISSNQSAYAASVDWVARRKHGLDKRDFHSLSWLHYGYLQQGLFQKARECIDTAWSAAQQTGDSRSTMAVVMMRARQLLAANETEEEGLTLMSLGYSSQPAKMAGLLALGLTAAKNGDLETAAVCQEKLRDLGNEEPSSAWEREMAEEAKIMALEVDGLIAHARGDKDHAKKILAEAAALELASPTPRGPVTPIKPAIELYGEFLLDQVGQPREASRQFAEALLRTPLRPEALLGMARSLAKAGEKEQAERYFRELATIWRDAEPGTPGLDQIKPFLAQAQPK